MPEPDFKCVICQAECLLGPPDGSWAFCEDCCPDHQYEYDSYDRHHNCIECGHPAPPEWYQCDDDVWLGSSGPVGVTLSQVTGPMLDAMADSCRGI